MLAVCLRLPHRSNKSKQSRSKCWLQMSSVWTSEEEKLFVLLRFKMAGLLQTLWKKHHNRHFSVTFLLWDGKRGQIWFCDLLRVLEKVTTNNTSKYETTGTSSLWAAADGHSPAEQKHLKKTSFQCSLLNLQGSNCEFYSVILVRNI